MTSFTWKSTTEIRKMPILASSFWLKLVIVLYCVVIILCTTRQSIYALLILQYISMLLQKTNGQRFPYTAPSWTTLGRPCAKKSKILTFSAVVSMICDVFSCGLFDQSAIGPYYVINSEGNSRGLEIYERKRNKRVPLAYLWVLPTYRSVLWRYNPWL